MTEMELAWIAGRSWDGMHLELESLLIAKGTFWSDVGTSSRNTKIQKTQLKQKSFPKTLTITHLTTVGCDKRITLDGGLFGCDR